MTSSLKIPEFVLQKILFTIHYPDDGVLDTETCRSKD